MQRHSVPAMPSRICASVGRGLRSSSALAVMICPFWQKPHCGTCSSIQACCSGCSVPSLAMPSSVVTSPFTADVGVMHDRVATPLMMTVHDPHCPSPQPNRGPSSPRSLRRMYSSGVDGSMSTVWAAPFTRNVMMLMYQLSLRHDANGHRDYQPTGVRNQGGIWPGEVVGRTPTARCGPRLTDETIAIVLWRKPAV